MLKPSLEVLPGPVPVLADRGARSSGYLVAYTSRRGGTSRVPYDSLNLAARVGDHPAAVGDNRRRVARACAFDDEGLALARQVHGSSVIEVHPGMNGVVGIADVLVARRPGVTVGVLTADCAAVLVVGERGVAAAHAGWRGLVAGAISAAVDEVAPAIGAWVGPCIHDCCYEVGPEVIAAFEGAGLPVGAGRIDIRAGAVRSLEDAGVEQIHAVDICTSCDPRYFSYRRDGITGRQGAFVGISDG